jgi:hypothetical protein
MLNKRFWLGFAAIYVVTHVLGFLVHEVLLSGAYERLAQLWRPEEEMRGMMWIFYITSAVYLWVFCYIFTKGYENRGLMEGVRYGLLMGLFMSVPWAFDSFVIFPIPMSLALSWFVSGIVVFVILGVIFAAIYRPEQPAAGDAY